MLLLGSLILSPAAAAKAFRPGVVSLCSGQGCVAIKSQRVMKALAAFYYDSAQRPVRIGAPTAGSRSFKLEFSNGYVSGIAAGSNLDRFRSGGVNLDQFRKGAWYRLRTSCRLDCDGWSMPRRPAVREAACPGSGDLRPPW